MKRRILAFLLASVFCIPLTACLDEDVTMPEEAICTPQHTETTVTAQPKPADLGDTWAIYWYLCGSDLESDGGFATNDLNEMFEVELPENVKVVIQTGGSSEWQNDIVDSSKLERYLYSSEGFELVDRQPLGNMAAPETLAEFLNFCETNYPADKTMVLFWNHGGGSVSGAAFDENFSGDSMTLDEFYQAFQTAYDLSSKARPVDVVGFDTCLMATVDTAYTFSDIAEYMVASEELEPGGGWFYTGWLQTLTDNPQMDGAALGKAICDSYMEGCKADGTSEEATLSVIDLSKLNPLLDAYEAMGAEALTYALDDPQFFCDLGREAMRSENYGGNTDEQGYTNMVDLGHLALNSAEILPEKSQAVLDGLNECVIYKVNGEYREHASGLSCYYSYNGDLNDLRGYKSVGCSESFKYLYSYGIEGELTPDGMEFIDGLGYEDDSLPKIPVLNDGTEEEYPLYIDNDGYAVMELEENTVNMLKSVTFYLSYIDEDNDIMLMLGQDNNIYADWANGIFKDNFTGAWGAIDGHIVYMEIFYEGEDYTSYSVPILLNGEEYNLHVIYDYADENYYVLGARKGLEDNGMADKNLIQLKPGDEISTIHYASAISSDTDFTAVTMDTFTVTEAMEFSEVDMGDGVFVMMFELEDAKNNTVYSQFVQFTVDGDSITTEILDQ